MANLRGNSLVGGKPIVTIDMLNKFVEDIQAAQKDEMMHKYEREVITSNQVIDAYIKDKSKNGVWLCSNVQEFPMYNYGTLVNLSADGSRFQLYAPHIKGSSDKYNSTAGLFFRTGWGNDIKEWKEVADIKYVNEKDNEIKEEINNSLKTEQYLSHEGLSVYAENTIEGRTEDIKIYGKTLNNLCILNNEEYTTNSNIVHSLGKNFKPLTKYMLICDIKDSQGLNVTEKTTYLRVDDKTGIVLGGYVGNISTNFSKIFFEFTTLKNITGYLYLRQRLTVGTQQTIKNIVILEYDENYTNINYFEGIKSFGEEENNTINISSNGVNVFSAKKLEEINYGNRFKLIDANSNTFQLGNHNDKNLDLIKLMNLNLKGKRNVTFYLSSRKVSGNGIGLFMIFFEDGTFLYAGNIDGGVFKKTFEKPIDKIVFSYSDGGVTEFSKVCISEKNIDFKPYEEESLKIQLKEPLRGINNIKDCIYEENGKIKINRFLAQTTLIGNEDWIFNTQKENIIRFKCFVDKKPENSGSTKIISNRLPSNGDTIDMPTIFSYTVHGIVVAIEKNKLQTQDVEGFKKWLKSNPITVIYQLAEPIIENVENCIDMNVSSFKDRTYININNNIKGSLNAKIPTNIYSLINNNGSNINKIYKKLKESFFIKTILLTDWQQSQDAFKYSIKHNLGTRLIANVAATKVDGMSTNIDYKIVDENTIEIYVIDKAQLDIIIKTI